MPRYKVGSAAPVATIDISQADATGMIKSAPSGIVPAGHLPCDGTFRNIVDFPQLYNYLTQNLTVVNPWGTDVGVTFRLPDCQGLGLRGVDGAAGRDPDKTSRTAINTGGATGNSVASYQADEHIAHSHGGGSHSHTGSSGGVGDHTHAHYHQGFNAQGGYGASAQVFASNSGGSPTTDGAFIVGAGGHAHNITVNAVGATISSNGGNESRGKNVNVLFVIKT